jgi:hypothetical protein
MGASDELTADLAGVVDAVCNADPTALADGEAIVALHRQLDRLEAATTRASAAFDAERRWDADGARSAAAWMAVRCNHPVRSARQRVRLGRELRHMAAVEKAWLAGDIGVAHVASLARARTPVTEACFARDEEQLVFHAVNHTYRGFVRALAYWSQLADPDGVENAAEAAHEARRLHLSQSFEGQWFLDGVLDPIAGAIVAKALKKIEAELFEHDWSEARDRVGDGVCMAGLARSPAQRRGDALVGMARRATAMKPGSRLPAPLFTVLVGYETFVGRTCELANGTVVNPGSLVPWLNEAWVERVVFDSPSRVIDVGMRRRLFDGATRRAVEVRDRECFHELCDIPADDCQIDHIEPWADGGLTVEANGRAACGAHNRSRHRRR